MSESRNGPPVVLVEKRDRVLLLTINRPDVRNAVNAEVARLIGDTLEVASLDPEVRAVVLTGAGDKAFSAGADLRSLAAGEAIIPPGRESLGFAGIVRRSHTKPVVGAVNGFALGGGTEIALACDIVMASEDATFGLPEVRRGIIAGAGGVFRLARQVPEKVALEILLTGASISARRAHEIGLVNHVVAADDLLSSAVELAEVISANAPLAVEASRRVALDLVERTRGGSEAEAQMWTKSELEMAAIRETVDAKEGTRAFVEKRAARWTAK